MTQLDDILLILDPHEREETLLKYSRSLGIDPLAAQLPSGRYHEEKLVVLIYDALRSQKKRRSVNLLFLLAAVVVLTMGITFVRISPQIADLFYQEPPVQTQSATAARTGNKAARPILNNPMQGSYVEYDERGRPVYETVYQGGQLISRRKMDRNGRVVSEETFASQAPRRK